MTTPRAADPEQYTVWNGEDGRMWREHRHRLDAMAEGANGPLFDAAAVAPGEHVLDVGCGTGQTTRLAARRAAPGHVCGVDLSGPLLAQARQDARGIDNVEFVHADAQLHPFPRGRFDVVISRAGVMFFADPVAAFGNIRHAMRSGGRLAFVCHRDAPGPARDLFAAVAGHLPMWDHTTGPADLVDFTDPARIRGVLTDAGFSEVDTSAVEYRSEWGSDVTETVRFLFDNQLRALVADAPPAAVRDAELAAARVLTGCRRDGRIEVPAPGWLVTAVNP
ncbi:ubiquinone/menaquinone biosynthesis C-methylase UbiE [Stackebrandtia albiflava]|uniref:Ubiquinone/menaquinone biosynthesis C-methylase UbiE n=1 Tax=Stackebrandtia albiflava TaxID=406432 RepID=A0A562VAM7_9ACTN|nr:class I SAM-dependent methyltransferase [Stackebrandtia albiflava]TWJ14901.1 ubiquinone/menaquinone biosynthesis C-methylase UbiE [Stackebrandtia albiflava]